MQQPRLRAAYHEGNIAWRLRPRILRTLFYALIASVVDIAVCFAALPWTPTLATARLAIPLVVVTVSLGITCLALSSGSS